MARQKNLEKLKSVAEYISANKEVESNKRKLESGKKIKIAILSSSTITGIKEILRVKCFNLGITCKFYLAPYNQYSQKILNKKSALYKLDPDLVIISIDIKNLLGENYFFPYKLSEKERKKIKDKRLKEIYSLINTLSGQISGKIVLHNFEVPTYSALGILENKQSFGFIEMIMAINRELAVKYKNDSQVFVFDFESFCSKYGKFNILDSKMYYLGDIKIGFEYLPHLCEEYMAFIKPIMSLSKKCIVLDLDNTLWGGIIGEDGLRGIKLGPTPEGRPFLEFQKYLLNLFERGIILAINSRNNPRDALKVLKKHPHMLLKEKHFASIVINWQDKASNLEKIAKEINIGLDSLVFIDDDEVNREIVKQALPEVLVVDLPDNPSEYVETLMKINDFNTLQISVEDKEKGKMYADQRKRRKVEESATDISQFLKGLKIKVTISPANSFTIPRISQLTQKTNQFNLTTRRYLEEGIRKFAKSKNHLVFSAKVNDKFGDSGITGVVIIKEYKKTKKWLIDSFLLSCRVLGRNIEKAIMAFIIQKAKKNKINSLIGEFIPTQKNVPAKDFYKSCGFYLSSKKNRQESWSKDLKKSEYEFPKFIKVVIDE